MFPWARRLLYSERVLQAALLGINRFPAAVTRYSAATGLVSVPDGFDESRLIDRGDITRGGSRWLELKTNADPYELINTRPSYGFASDVFPLALIDLLASEERLIKEDVNALTINHEGCAVL